MTICSCFVVQLVERINQWVLFWSNCKESVLISNWVKLCIYIYGVYYILILGLVWSNGEKECALLSNWVKVWHVHIHLYMQFINLMTLFNSFMFIRKIVMVTSPVGLLLWGLKELSNNLIFFSKFDEDIRRNASC